MPTSSASSSSSSSSSSSAAAPLPPPSSSPSPAIVTPSYPPARNYLQNNYPWTAQRTPLISSAPMRLISGARLACAVSSVGGLGFLGAGTEATAAETLLGEAAEIFRKKPLYVFEVVPDDVRAKMDEEGEVYETQRLPMPVGIGFILWAISDTDLRTIIIPALHKYRPAAVWLFAPRGDEPHQWLQQVMLWAYSVRTASPLTHIWLQIGSVREVQTMAPQLLANNLLDVLVVQGSDAGGHGLGMGASLMTLLPEVSYHLAEMCRAKGVPSPHVVAAGGIALPSHMLSTWLMRAHGVSMGTAFLTTTEANVADGYRQTVMAAADGGQSTIRTRLYDRLRGTSGWPKRFAGRGLINQSWDDATQGRLSERENGRQYRIAERQGKQGVTEGVWGREGRMTAYAGTGCGLCYRRETSAEDVVKNLRQGFDTLVQSLGISKFICATPASINRPEAKV